MAAAKVFLKQHCILVRFSTLSYHHFFVVVYHFLLIITVLKTQYFLLAPELIGCILHPSVVPLNRPLSIANNDGSFVPVYSKRAISGLL